MWVYCVLYCCGNITNTFTHLHYNDVIMNEHDGVSTHQPNDYLLNRLFRRRSKKSSKLCVTGVCAVNSPLNSPHKGPVRRKMFPFDDVIMNGLSTDTRESYAYICSWEIWICCFIQFQYLYDVFISCNNIMKLSSLFPFVVTGVMHCVYAFPRWCKCCYGIYFLVSLIWWSRKPPL